MHIRGNKPRPENEDCPQCGAKGGCPSCYNGSSQSDGMGGMCITCGGTNDCPSCHNPEPEKK